MALSPASSRGSGSFTGGTITTPLVANMADPSATALRINEQAGAIAQSGIALEVIDENSNALLSISARGTHRVVLPSSQAAAGFIVQDQGTASYFEVDANGLLILGEPTVPNSYVAFRSPPVVVPSALLAQSMFALWLDDTVGATKLMIKAKDSGGTVRTASIALA